MSRMTTPRAVLTGYHYLRLGYTRRETLPAYPHERLEPPEG